MTTHPYGDTEILGDEAVVRFYARDEAAVGSFRIEETEPTALRDLAARLNELADEYEEAVLEESRGTDSEWEALLSNGDRVRANDLHSLWAEARSMYVSMNALYGRTQLAMTIGEAGSIEPPAAYDAVVGRIPYEGGGEEGDDGSSLTVTVRFDCENCGTEVNEVDLPAEDSDAHSEAEVVCGHCGEETGRTVGEVRQEAGRDE